MGSALKEILCMYDYEMVKIRNCPAILVGHAFSREVKPVHIYFYLISLSVTSLSTSISIPEKYKKGVARTLCCKPNRKIFGSLIDLLLRYDRLRRSLSTNYTYYWSIDGYRTYLSARTISEWMIACGIWSLFSRKEI